MALLVPEEGTGILEQHVLRLTDVETAASLTASSISGVAKLASDTAGLVTTLQQHVSMEEVTTLCRELNAAKTRLATTEQELVSTKTKVDNLGTDMLMLIEIQ